MSHKSILRKVGNEPVVGVSGCLLITPNTNEHLTDTTRNATLEFIDASNQKMIIKPPSQFNPQHTPLVHEMPPIPIMDYIRNFIKGLDVKQSVDLATTSNIDLSQNYQSSSPPLSIDGKIVNNGDRILIKNQTDATQNGIYNFNNGIFQRAPDFIDSSGNDNEGFVTIGAFAYVENGSTNSNRSYVVTKINTSDGENRDRIRVGTDPINFGQFSSQGSLTNTFNIDTTNINDDGNIIVYDRSSSQFVVGKTSYVNNVKQNYYEIRTEQPFKFTMSDPSRNIGTGSVSINWSFDDIIARNNVPNGTRKKESKLVNNAKQMNLPYIHQIQVDISGTTGSNTPSGWQSYQTITIDDSHDYYLSSNTYNSVKSEQLQYNTSKIYKTNSGGIINELSNANEIFDARVYGINNADDSVAIRNSRALVYKGLFFTDANPPSKPFANGSETISTTQTPTVTISRNFRVSQTESGNSGSAARINSAMATYSISETLASGTVSDNQNNITQTYSYSSDPKSNNENFLVTLSNAYGANSGLKFATKYSYSVSAQNDLNTSFSPNSDSVASGFTPMPTANPSNTSFTVSDSTTKTNIFNESLNNSNQIYINISTSNDARNKNNFTISQSSTLFQVSHPNPTLSSSGNGFGKFIDALNSLVTVTIIIDGTNNQTIAFNGFNSLGTNNGVTINPNNENFIDTAALSTFCIDMFANDGNSRRKGLRLTGKLTLNDIANANINNFIGDASENAHTLIYNISRHADVGGTQNQNIGEFNIYVDSFGEEPTIDNSSNTITVTDVVFTMGIPSVKYFKLDISRNYQNMNSQYKYLRGDGTIAKFGSLSLTNAQPGTNINKVKISQNSIVTSGAYSFTPTEINSASITNGYYQTINYTSAINGEIDLSFNEVLYSLNTTTNGISVQHSIPVDHYFDFNSYNISSNDITRKLDIDLYEIRDVASLGTNVGSIILDAYSTNTINSNHSNPVKDWTLLYINGKFRIHGDTNVTYPNISDYNFDNAIDLNQYTNYVDYTTNKANKKYNLSGSEAGNGENGYKWIVFSIDLSTDVSTDSGTNTPYLNIPNLFGNYFDNISNLKDNGDTSIIGFIKATTNTNGNAASVIGNLSRDFNSLSTWQSQTSNKSLSSVFSDSDHGSIHTVNSNNWGPVVDSSAMSDVYICIAMTSDSINAVL